MAQNVAESRQDNNCLEKLAPLIAGGDVIQTLCHITSTASESETDEILLVCGSFFIMSDVRKFFFRNESSDADPAHVNNF